MVSELEAKVSNLQNQLRKDGVIIAGLEVWPQPPYRYPIATLSPYRGTSLILS